jgi:plastocyanin
MGVVIILVSTMAGSPVIPDPVATAQGRPASVSMVQGASNQSNGKFFEPPDVNVKTGGTVKWTNNDITAHTVTAGTPDQGPSQQFDSGLINPKGTYQETFSNTGTIDYYCTIHPWMVGKVIVA